MRRTYHAKPKISPIHHLRINEFIRVPRILLIDETGKNYGDMPTLDALAMAREHGLDLVEVFPKAQPPVCKIMDYGKYLYQESKQKRLAQAKQKKVDIKGIRLGFRTEEHDLDFKKNQADKFLLKGNKVKIEIILRGREKAHQDIARDNLRKFVNSISTPHRIEDDIKRFPGGFNMLIAPQ